jgi:hypothetical protein
MLESGTSGTVGGEGGNVLVYPAAPDRDEFETSLGEMIVAWRWLMTARAHWLRTLAGLHFDLEVTGLMVRLERGALVDEAWKMINLVEQRDDPHAVLFLLS